MAYFAKAPGIVAAPAKCERARGGAHYTLGLIRLGMRIITWIAYFARRAWVRFKLLLGGDLDHEKNFLASDFAWRLKTHQLPRSIRFTCGGREDGLGMQALAKISCLTFSRIFRTPYVHQPFQSIAHCNGDMAQWATAWEKTLNLGSGELQLGVEDEVVDYKDYFLGKRTLGPHSVLRLQQCFWLTRNEPGSLLSLESSLKQKFIQNTPPPSLGCLIVAAHVRRGDVGKTENSERYTSDSKILATLLQIKAALDKGNIDYVIHLHSEGSPSDFEEFVKIGCVLHINESAIETFTQLARSDILVMSKSSFCYVAALINDGVKFYEKSANPPLPDWIKLKRDGSFASSDFEKALQFLGNREEFNGEDVRPHSIGCLCDNRISQPTESPGQSSPGTRRRRQVDRMEL